MSEHRVKLNWRRTSKSFDPKLYNRSHTLTFKNGQAIKASATPAYRGDSDMIDPEEAFVGSMASCHMLTFLFIAARQGLVIDSYEDDPVGYLEKNAEGRLAITRVVMRPRIAFGGDKSPDPDTLRQMHDQAHHDCFIANSAKTEVMVESPQTADA
ncbi:MAG: OsmC family protein [Phycisphaerales bacterium]|nr:OsmC family protein [Phycisphaerales bacterium]